jgi:hypothetical protein
MRKAPDPSAMARLGLASGAFIIWMPTYRATDGAGGGAWRDAPDLSERASPEDTEDPVSQITRLAAAAGVELVVKPHPLDAGRYATTGLRVITTDEIFRSGMTMYQFIGASAGMISDYSSVWVEYLALDRPLVLYCPDIDDYVRGRGFSDPPMTEIVPDLIVEDAKDIGAFFDAVASQDDWRPEARKSAREALGLTTWSECGVTFTSAILHEIERSRTSRAGGNAPQDAPAAPPPPGAAMGESEHRNTRRAGGAR